VGPIITKEKGLVFFTIHGSMLKCIFSRCFFLLGSLMYMYYMNPGRKLLIFRLIMSEFLLLVWILLLEGFQDIQPFCQLLLYNRERPPQIVDLRNVEPVHDRILQICNLLHIGT
jgi:hypothetical protein